MLIKLLGLLFTGFLLGIQHSLDADHVAAISTLVSQKRSFKRSAWIGAAWGLGHTTVLLVVGVALMILKVSIPNAVARSFEFLVGVMLLYLGVNLLRKLMLGKLHIHRHRHGEVEHIHLHTHAMGSAHEHLHQPFLIGMVHGLAGSAGIVLLITASMNSIAQGVLFTLTFGVGSILGMLVTGSIISLPFLATQKFGRLNQSFMILAAIVTIAIGVQALKENWMF
jgi:high-affinity nickel permease